MNTKVFSSLILAAANTLSTLINAFIFHTCHFKWPFALIALQSTCLFICLEVLIRINKIERLPQQSDQQVHQEHLFTSAFYVIAFYGFWNISLQITDLQHAEIGRYLALPILVGMITFKTFKYFRIMNIIFSACILIGIVLFFVIGLTNSITVLAASSLSAAAFAAIQINVSNKLNSFQITSLQYLSAISKPMAWFAVIASFVIESWDDEVFWTHKYTVFEIIAIIISCALFVFSSMYSFHILGTNSQFFRLPVILETVIIFILSIFISSSGGNFFMKLIGFLITIISAVLLEYSLSTISMEDANEDKHITDGDRLITNPSNDEDEMEEYSSDHKEDSNENEIVERKAKPSNNE